MNWQFASGRPLSFGARPWCDVRAVASNTHPAFALQANRRHCAGCLLGGGVTRKLAARVRRAALVAIGPLNIERPRTGKRPLILSVRQWCDVPAVTSNTHPALAWRAKKCHCAGCLSGGGDTGELAAHAACRTGSVRPMHHKVALRRRKTSVFRRKAVVRRASCSLQRAPGIRVASEQVPLRWLSFKRWRNMQACRAHTQCHACRDRLTYHRETLHWQEASNPECKTVVRRASYGLQRAPCLCVAREQAPLRWLSLGREAASNASLPRAQRAALVVIGQCTTK